MRENFINRSSPRKRGPIRRGLSFWAGWPTPIATTKACGYGSLLSQGVSLRTLSTGRPRESGDPYAAASPFGRDGRHLLRPQKPVAMGPCCRRASACELYQQVVPAKAGTHTPRPLLLGGMADTYCDHKS